MIEPKLYWRENGKDHRIRFIQYGSTKYVIYNEGNNLILELERDYDTRRSIGNHQECKTNCTADNKSSRHQRRQENNIV